jgi:transcriptional regulator with XRE-family HTH domain
MKLADYLNNYGWSQADLAREADISPQTVARALAGETLSRRNAAKIVEALDRKWQTHAKGHLTLASIRGLKVTELTRKTSGRTKQSEETAGEHTE